MTQILVRLAFFPVRYMRVALTLLLGTVVLGIGCAAQQGPFPEVNAQARNAEDLRVVDCLLPGRIKKLGRMITYLSPRRPIKTPAVNCEILGGEYVAYDRANYATALKIWLPQAEQGDPAAQTYVGEIYEKGLGIQPDFGLAAQWYEKAAAQGYSRAQVNLGHLYEEGRGVPKDTVSALNWYRKASGLSDELQLASAFQIQRQALSKELEASTRQRSALERQLEEAEQEMDRLRRELAKGAAARERQRQEPEAAVERRRRQIAETQAELGAKQSRLQEALQAVQRDKDALQAELRQQRQMTESLQRELGTAGERVAEREAALNDATAALEQTRRELERRRQGPDAVEQGAEIERLQAELQAREASVASIREEMVALRSESGARESRLTEELADAKQELARLEADLGGNSKEAESLRQQLDSAHEKLAAQDAKLGTLRRRVNEEQTQAEQQRRATNIERRELKARLKKLEAEVASKQRDIEQLESKARTAPSGPARGVPATLLTNIDLGNYHALIIGNDEYQHLPDLKTAVHDAKAVQRILKQNYAFSTQLLLNADREEIFAKLYELSKRLTDQDNLLIYYAGHGYLDESDGRGFWQPVDAEPNKQFTWIRDQEIAELIEPSVLSARHVMIVADSCYSRANVMKGTSVPRPPDTLSDEQRLKLVKVLAKNRARLALTSGGLEPVPDIGGGQNSVFAKAFLDVLEQNNELLESSRLYYEIYQRVRLAFERLGIREGLQYAVIQYAGHESGGFLLEPRNRVGQRGSTRSLAIRAAVAPGRG
jgi:hypothetical protein